MRNRPVPFCYRPFPPPVSVRGDSGVASLPRLRLVSVRPVWAGDPVDRPRLLLLQDSPLQFDGHHDCCLGLHATRVR